MAWRNWRYDQGVSVATVGVPVISVGNITTGGTGKTPLVVDIAQRAQARGRTVAVLSRGYKARKGELADELVYISRRLPGVVCIQDPDRTAAAGRAVKQHRADAIVLDDAFQHRRLGRDLDVVAVDATCPFGFGYLLPRGMLREPPGALGRADLIVITRADQVEPAALDELQVRLEEAAPGVSRVACRHKPVGLLRLDGGAPEPAELEGRRVVCASGIGSPGAFEGTVRQMGADVGGHLVFADHHRYRAEDVARIMAEAKRCDADLVVITEKDAVKLAGLPADGPCPVAVLRVDIDFMEDGATILASALDSVLSGGGAADAQA
jgi:tetraacyldisaccharide 4'-kinase